jgi:hypothetical protein
MERYFELFSKIIYCAIALALMLMAFVLVAISVWNLITGALTGQGSIGSILHSVGLIIVSAAVFDVGKFLIEEEVLRDRELRSIREVRRSLTKFMSIIIIATSLEALVIVFETKQEMISDLLYPSGLLVSAILALVGLGVFVWLSSKADALLPREAAAAEAEGQDEPVELTSDDETP